MEPSGEYLTTMQKLNCSDEVPSEQVLYFWAGLVHISLLVQKVKSKMAERQALSIVFPCAVNMKLRGVCRNFEF